MKQTHFTRLAAWLTVLVVGLFLPTGVWAAASAADGGRYALQAERTGDDGQTRLLLGGMTFGVKLHTDGAMIVGMGENEHEKKETPAYKAGLRVRDVIFQIDGRKVAGTADVTRAVGESEGRTMAITVQRDGEEMTFTVTPKREKDGSFSIGVWLRDSSAGVGTVTFIDPETGAFGGLGHGICDRDTGKLIPMKRGDVRTAVINGITKGRSGKPGELRGSLSRERCGALLSNTACGVFGIYAEIPSGATAVTVAAPSEITLGKATLYTSLGDESVTGYEIEISSIVDTPTKTKCFTVRVTDPRLIERTGGIVQGMSGSPIVQNGKLVGAVTHVTISDAQCGYGIFIENMLAEMPRSIRP